MTAALKKRYLLAYPCALRLYDTIEEAKAARTYHQRTEKVMVVYRVVETQHLHPEKEVA